MTTNDEATARETKARALLDDVKPKLLERANQYIATGAPLDAGAVAFVGDPKAETFDPSIRAYYGSDPLVWLGSRRDFDSNVGASLPAFVREGLDIPPPAGHLWAVLIFAPKEIVTIALKFEWFTVARGGSA